MLTREQAIQLGETKFWLQFSDLEVVQFQLFEERLCMPIDDFLSRLTRVLNRTVTLEEISEFSGIDMLRIEFTNKFFTPVSHDHFARSSGTR